MHNNNICWYGGEIQEALVRQRPSNREHQPLNQNESKHADPIDETSPDTLAPISMHLLDLYKEHQFGLDRRKPGRLSSNGDKDGTQIIK